MKNWKSGKTCSKCEIAKPLTFFSKDIHKKDGKTSSCKECIKNLYKVNKEKKLKKAEEYREANREKIRQSDKERYYANRDEVLENRKIYRLNNLEKCKNRYRKYYENNKEKYRAWAKKRELAKKDRVPLWFSEFDEFVIEEAYKTAKERSEVYGISFHVDHIIPLQGKEVSGFHCAANIQVITAKENLCKGNKLLERYRNV